MDGRTSSRCSFTTMSVSYKPFMVSVHMKKRKLVRYTMILVRARDRNLGKMQNDVWLLTGVKRDPRVQPFAIAPPSMPTRVTEVPSRRREKLGHRPAGARVGGADTCGKGMDWWVSFRDQSLASWPTTGRQEGEGSRHIWIQVDWTKRLPQPGKPELKLVSAFAEDPSELDFRCGSTETGT